MNKNSKSILASKKVGSPISLIKVLSVVSIIAVSVTALFFALTLNSSQDVAPEDSSAGGSCIAGAKCIQDFSCGVGGICIKDTPNSLRGVCKCSQNENVKYTKLSCASWTNVWINNCNSFSKYSSNNPDCTNRKDYFDLNTNMDLANVEKTFIQDVDPSVDCAKLNTGWKSWSFPNNKTASWPANSQLKSQKVCFKFENPKGSVQCGAIIRNSF